MTDPVRQAEDIQCEAATPRRQVVLSASAGSGKTKVLVDRFLRLCLEGDLDPRAVLAITFTRRATVEVQERLQGAARRLATLSGAELDEALSELLGRQPTPRERERAAWFHEDLLEDPAGLGISTLHSFCEKILSRFAAAVGLDPRFSVIDDRREVELRAEALDRLEADLAADPVAADAHARLAPTVGGARGKLVAVFKQRMHLQRWFDRVVPPPASPAAALSRPLSPHLGALVADLRDALLARTPFAGAEDPDPALLAGPLAAALRELAGCGLDLVLAADGPDGPTEGLRKTVAGMRQDLLAAATGLETDPHAIEDHLRLVRGAILTGDGKKLQKPGRRPTTRDERLAAFAAATAPVLRLLSLLRLPGLLAVNTTLLRGGLCALDHYAAIKRRDRVVDFQDLEYLALRLLTNEETGHQVHFRLDARLDHLLLDEFQDTNRNQWELLRPLITEVLAGGEAPRSAFVVGDPKQSIYGFRGAEPRVFDEAAALFVRLAGADTFLELPTNFRSLGAIVDTVGEVFARPPLGGLLGDHAAGATQLVARTGAPGRVSFVQAVPGDDDREGDERAAAAVASLVRGLIDGTGDAEAGRTVRPHDIVILARKKTHLAAYEIALRRAGVPFLPAGRGLLARTREVQDLLALLRWLANEADDAAGATVLRSPCFRLPEAMVQQLLVARRSGRRRSLRAVIRDHDGSGGMAEIGSRLEGWFQQAGLSTLHDLLRRVYREGDLLARFEIAGGEQARFNLMRLFDLALAAEGRGGSLRDFVDELERAEKLGGEDEGALPGEEGAGRVRVMTVHGAKGLEAPVVILADAAARLRDDTAVLELADDRGLGPWVQDVTVADYRGPEAADGSRLPAALTAPHEEALRRSLAEEAHILYVALTRARDRLVVIGGVDGRRGETYLDWLAAADDGRDGAPARWSAAEDFLAAHPPVTMPAESVTPARRAALAASRLQTWTPPSLAPRFALEAPSRLDDDRAATGLRRDDPADDPDAQPAPPHRGDNEATRRGSRIHAWLERACRSGEFPPPPAGHEGREEWEEAGAVWDDPALAWIFRPATVGGRGLSEVPVMLRRREGRNETRVAGFVDRLVLRQGCVDIVDYKSNRREEAAVPGLVDHYRPQLAAYREALTLIYPDRNVRSWLVWTAPSLAAVRLTEVTDP